MQQAGGEQAIPTAFSGISSLTLATTFCLLSGIGVQPDRILHTHSIPFSAQLRASGFGSRQVDNPEDAE